MVPRGLVQAACGAGEAALGSPRALWRSVGHPSERLFRGPKRSRKRTQRFCPNRAGAYTGASILRSRGSPKRRPGSPEVAAELPAAWRSLPGLREGVPGAPGDRPEGRLQKQAGPQAARITNPGSHLYIYIYIYMYIYIYIYINAYTYICIKSAGLPRIMIDAVAGQRFSGKAGIWKEDALVLRT